MVALRNRFVVFLNEHFHIFTIVILSQSFFFFRTSREFWYVRKAFNASIQEQKKWRFNCVRKNKPESIPVFGQLYFETDY
jgi:hypothetical protein